MKAARYYGPGDLRVEEVDDPVPGPGEVLLEVHAAGICGTDAAEWEHGPVLYAIGPRHRLTGHAGPLIPGHEFSGRVVSAGPDVATLGPDAIVACGAGFVVGDDPVADGRPNLSDNYATVGLQCDGGLAQYVAVPASVCLDVGPYGLSEDAAALAQPMAIAVHSLRRAHPIAGEDAVVIGVGGIGAFLTYAAVEAGLRVVASDLDADRLELAKRFGAHAVVDAREQPDLVAALADLDFRPKVVYEVTGSLSGLSAALASVTKGGRVVFVGLHEQPRQLDLRRLTLSELELVGSNAHVFAVDLPEALRVLASRRQPWSDVAPTAVPLEALVEHGLRPIAEGHSTRIKTLIDPWSVEPRPTRMAAHAAGAQ